MVLWLCLLAAFASNGNGSERKLLFFSSPNCVACRAIQPVIDELRSEGCFIRTIDTDSDQDSKNQWHIQAVPTLIVLENGVEVDRIIGKLSRVELQKRLSAVETPKVVQNIHPPRAERRRARIRVRSTVQIIRSTSHACRLTRIFRPSHRQASATIIVHFSAPSIPFIRDIIPREKDSTAKAT